MSATRYLTMTGSHLIGRIATMFTRAQRRARDREDLGRMTDLDLHDAGLSRAALAYELNKPIWRG